MRNVPACRRVRRNGGDTKTERRAIRKKASGKRTRREEGGSLTTFGEPEAARLRLRALDNIPVIEITEEVEIIAERLLSDAPLPSKARVDALHIAVATVGGADYLLTWNCTHIANPAFRRKIESVIRSFGYEPPVICTPQEFSEV